VDPGPPASRDSQPCLKFFDIFDLRAGIRVLPTSPADGAA
jgi:hypothetical protein